MATYEEFVAELRATESDPLVRVAKMFSPKVLKVTPQFHAILSYILDKNDEAWTNPQISSMHITSDGFMLINNGNEFLGSAEDLMNNLRGLLPHMELTTEEIEAFVKAAKKHIYSQFCDTFNLDSLIPVEA